MEGSYCETVELGIESQPNPNLPKPPPFNLRKDSSNSHNPSTNKSAWKATQGKKKTIDQANKQALAEVNTNSISKPNSISILNANQGKENTLLGFQATFCATKFSMEDHGGQSRLSHQAIDVPTSTPSTECNQVGSTPGKNLVCGATNGTPIPYCGDPPDPRLGGSNGNLDGSNPGAAGAGGNNEVTQ